MRYILIILSLTVIYGSASAVPSAVTTTDVAGGFSSPVGVTHAGDGSGRLFVIEQAGRIKVVDGGVHLTTPFLDISALVTSGGEQGLLGLAFHPDYASNRYFYVNYTNLSGDTVIARYSVSAGDSNIADAASALQVLSFDQPFESHNAGDMHFGPMDGYLYISTGDGGEASQSQNLNSLLGNILRIDVDADDFPADPDRNYSIPADNPYVGAAPGADEIWVSGFRNPWRFSFDRLTGDLFVADVGEDSWEEFNFLASGGNGGENFGWPCYEGDDVFDNTGCGPPDDYEYPFHALSHSDTNNNFCSAVSGYRYRGQQFSNFIGWYFFTDWCDGDMFVARELVSGGWEVYNLGTLIGGFAVTGFGEGEDGELYVVAWTALIQITQQDEIFNNGFNN